MCVYIYIYTHYIYIYIYTLYIYIYIYTHIISIYIRRKLHKNVESSIEHVLATTPHETPTIRTLDPITKTIQVRRTRHARHCWRRKDELISDILLWTPTYRCAKAGRPARTYIQQLCEDTGCNPEDLPEAMNDREKWQERVRDIRAGGATWWWWWWLSIKVLIRKRSGNLLCVPYWLISLVGRVFVNDPDDLGSVPVESYHIPIYIYTHTLYIYIYIYIYIHYIYIYTHYIYIYIHTLYIYIYIYTHFIYIYIYIYIYTFYLYIYIYIYTFYLYIYIYIHFIYIYIYIYITRGNPKIL